MINSWRKILAITDIGKGGTHDKYINIPKATPVRIQNRFSLIMQQIYLNLA